MEYRNREIKNSGRTCLRQIRVLQNGTEHPYAIVDVNNNGKFLRWAEKTDTIPAIYGNVDTRLVATFGGAR